VRFPSLTTDEAWVFFSFWGDRTGTATIPQALILAMRMGRYFSQSRMAEILRVIQMKGLLLPLIDMNTGERKYLRSGYGARMAKAINMPTVRLVMSGERDMSAPNCIEQPATVYIDAATLCA